VTYQFGGYFLNIIILKSKANILMMAASQQHILIFQLQFKETNFPFFWKPNI